ncbi:MAG: HD domain-containing protein, partial [Mariprofundus sp.]|nr:HD domain-containing protein [Mariprofundus sp.]
DVNMPSMDGYEVCRRLKEEPKTKDIPIIFVTSLTDAGDEERGFELGAGDYITKPVVPAIVQARVKVHLSASRRHTQLEEMVQKRTNELQELQHKLIYCLGKAGEHRDNETGAHVIRVGKSSEMLALAAGCDAQFAEKVLYASPMHDVGKIGIADHILLKPSKLSTEEFEIMKTHTTIGAEIVGDDLTGVAELTRSIVLGHHEKWNGSGYPSGLQGEAIPLECRIVAITDVFDALCSERPYKKAWPLGKVIEYFKTESGKHFDSELCQLFLALVPQVMALRKESPDE